MIRKVVDLFYVKWCFFYRWSWNFEHDWENSSGWVHGIRESLQVWDLEWDKHVIFFALVTCISRCERCSRIKLVILAWLIVVLSDEFFMVTCFQWHNVISWRIVINIFIVWWLHQVSYNQLVILIIQSIVLMCGVISIVYKPTPSPSMLTYMALHRKCNYGSLSDIRVMVMSHRLNELLTLMLFIIRICQVWISVPRRCGTWRSTTRQPSFSLFPSMVCHYTLVVPDFRHHYLLVLRNTRRVPPHLILLVTLHPPRLRHRWRFLLPVTWPNQLRSS